MLWFVSRGRNLGGEGRLGLDNGRADSAGCLALDSLAAVEMTNRVIPNECEESRFVPSVEMTDPVVPRR